MRTDVSGTNYYFIRSPPSQSSSRPQGTVKNCSDVVGNRDGVNPFSMVTNFTVQPHLDGEQFSNLHVLLRGFYGYPIDLAVAPVSTQTKYGVPSNVTLNTYALKTLARSNPSTATYSLPSFLAELKDLPELRETFSNIGSQLALARLGLRYIPTAIYRWGLRLIRAAADGHLAYRWAVRPLVSDLEAMLDFAGAVERRYRELGKLQREKSIRKRVMLDRDSTQDPVVEVFLHSDLDVWKAKRYTTFTSETWGTVQWNTTGLSDLPPLGEQRLALARRLVYGVTGYEALVALWEIFPWSWFIDWFVNIGTALQANNNVLFLTHSKSCVMRTTVSETTYQLSQKGTWSSLSALPYARQERKERWVIASPISFDPTFLTILDSGKWSILASLWVLDSKRRRRHGI